MAAKRTYSVRLDGDQREQLEARAIGNGQSPSELIRGAISAFLRQQEEKDYLSGVEERIAVTVNRLARQVEKDRGEQQIVVAMLDYLREWLAFTLPTPTDKKAANDLLVERNRMFLERLPLLFVSQSKANVTAFMEKRDQAAEVCPRCGTGTLRSKEGKKGVFWYCTNWDAMPACGARFSDAGGRPVLSGADAGGEQSKS